MQTVGIKFDFGNSDESIYLSPEQILYVKADGNYCDLRFPDGGMMKTIGMQRAEFAREIDYKFSFQDKIRFALVGKFYLVNLDYVLRIQPRKQLLTFSVNEPGKSEKLSIHVSVNALYSLMQEIANYQLILRMGAEKVGEVLKDRQTVDDELLSRIRNMYKSPNSGKKTGNKPTQNGGNGVVIGKPLGINGSLDKNVSKEKPICYDTDNEVSKLIGLNISDDDFFNVYCNWPENPVTSQKTEGPQQFHKHKEPFHTIIDIEGFDFE